MPSLVDYGDSDDDPTSKETASRKRVENPIVESGPPKRVARSETDAVLLRATEPEERLLMSSAADSLKESECLGHQNPKEKNSFQKIELTAESVIHLRENVKKLLSYRHDKGKSIIHHIGESGQFQNPYCLETIMSAFKINPYASNFPTLIYDPEAIEVFEGRRFAKFQMEAKFPPQKINSAAQAEPEDKSQKHQGSKRRSNKWDVKKK